MTTLSRYRPDLFEYNEMLDNFFGGCDRPQPGTGMVTHFKDQYLSPNDLAELLRTKAAVADFNRSFDTNAFIEQLGCISGLRYDGFIYPFTRLAEDATTAIVLTSISRGSGLNDTERQLWDQAFADNAPDDFIDAPDRLYAHWDL